ncbi:hypothetical protein CXG81DRAFT_12467 [Caulochytrium protostelioides]|uniref:Sugar phosphate transporter domain-containing protein n=1 Tax=Caulochytrium protostelioides TaxID=1555241 RepID=A0A4P9X756_9FUNG|nr:hypothetical protein CXG81DRAFT_12467 [Caulochytrium protostelioides]|eukprot:RKP01045.1 hypothetical protein CXG81DRAFT_12467 [Caulochytrium protostelioides]
MLSVVGLITTWYICSLSLSVFNKWLFSAERGLPVYPVSMTMFHFIVQGGLSYGITHYVVPKYRPARWPTAHNYARDLIPCGAATALDIGLSNLSLKLISLTFYTMVKSSVPVFVLLFAFLFGLEKPSLRLAGIMAVICVGVFLMVAGDTAFHLLGYTQVQFAAVLSGFRWAVTQRLLKGKEMGVDNPFATNLVLSPIMAVCLGLFALYLGEFGQLWRSAWFATTGNTLRLLGIGTAGGITAFLMVTAEFALISMTSIVTLSVAGICKEVVTILVSMMVFGDHLTAMNVVGLFVSLVGIALYNLHRVRVAQKRRLHDALTADKESESLSNLHSIQ